MPKVSVIVPVYNAEKTLARCIDSVLAQTFTDFELLLVNDGSKDSSGSICDLYAAKDSRIRVFHKENGGVSSARNLGLENATGERITFVDSDDWIEANFLSELFKIDNDIVISDYKYFDINNEITNAEQHIPASANLNTEDEVKEYFNRNFSRETFCANIWGKLYKTHLLRNLRFNKNAFVGEDTVFFLLALNECSSVSFNNKTNYMYFAVDFYKKYRMPLKEASAQLKLFIDILPYSSIKPVDWINRNFMTFCNVAKRGIYKRPISFILDPNFNKCSIMMGHRYPKIFLSKFLIKQVLRTISCRLSLLFSRHA